MLDILKYNVYKIKSNFDFSKFLTIIKRVKNFNLLLKSSYKKTSLKRVN